MKYKHNELVRYDITTPGTAGVAQRIASKNEIGGCEETSGLFALTRNEVMVCKQNQY